MIKCRESAFQVNQSAGRRETQFHGILVVILIPVGNVLKVRRSFLARLDKVQERAIVLPPASASALAATSA